MSEPIKTQEACTKAGGTWKTDDNTCTMPTSEAKGMNLEQRVMKVMEDVFDVKIKALEAKIDGKIDELLKAKEVEMEQALRKGFGLENDPTIHKSDMIAFFRKAQLEATESQKKTPAALEKAGPEGSKSTNPIDQIFDNYGGKA
jgi:hypothetical protein